MAVSYTHLDVYKRQRHGTLWAFIRKATAKMNTTETGGGQKAAPEGPTALHGAHLRTLDALFRHPPAHNLEWMDVISLIEKIGTAEEKSNNKFSIEVGGQHYLMHKPHGKELTSTEVVDLRHFLQRAGWSAGAPSQAAARLESLSLIHI